MKRHALQLALYLLAAPVLMLAIALGRKLYVTYQREHICKQKVELALSDFIRAAKALKLSNAEVNDIFQDEQEYLVFVREVSEKITPEIVDWDSDNAASVIFKSTRKKYAAMMVPRNAGATSCRDIQYKVITLR